MASKFQSRLVGTIILVAVGVIFLPDVLDGEKKHYKEEFAAIPIKPDFQENVEVFEVLEPVEAQTTLPDSPVEIVTELPDEATEKKPAAKINRKKVSSNDRAEVKLKPVPEKNQYKETAWIIQLMALKNADNASTLVKDLQKRGYRAYTKKEGVFTRVIVGPDISKEKLKKQIEELKKITGSKGQLLKFKPLNP